MASTPGFGIASGAIQTRTGTRFFYLFGQNQKGDAMQAQRAPQKRALQTAWRPIHRTQNTGRQGTSEDQWLQRGPSPETEAHERLKKPEARLRWLAAEWGSTWSAFYSGKYLLPTQSGSSSFQQSNGGFLITAAIQHSRSQTGPRPKPTSDIGRKPDSYAPVTCRSVEEGDQ